MIMKKISKITASILCMCLCLTFFACSFKENQEKNDNSEKEKMSFDAKQPKSESNKNPDNPNIKKERKSKTESKTLTPKKTTTDKSSKNNLQLEKAEIIIKESVSGISGTVNYGFCDYKSNYTLIKDEGKTKAASVIKLFIMEYVYSLIEKGEITETDVIGSESIKTLVESMITVSDNNATNILIDKFGMETINAYIKKQGYENTSLERKMLDTNAANAGFENYTSVSDVLKFLNNLYANREKFPQNRMLEIMKGQKISTKLRKNMPSDIEIASKTGELSDTQNDVAVVFTPKGDYAIVFITQNAPSPQINNAMADCNRRLYDEIYGINSNN